MAMPSMMPKANGANPTAKNHEKLIKDLKLTDKEAAPVRKILAEYRKDLALWAAKNGPEMAACQAQMKKYHRMRDPKVMAQIRTAMNRLSELSKEQVAKREEMLVKLTPEQRNKKHSKEDKSTFYSELLLYTRSKGYKESWASHKYRERYGVWPNAIKPHMVNGISDATRSYITSTQIRWSKSKGVAA